MKPTGGPEVLNNIDNEPTMPLIPYGNSSSGAMTAAVAGAATGGPLSSIDLVVVVLLSLLLHVGTFECL
jgi:hypothetical protein